MGRIFDDRANRVTPSYSRKGGVRHQYYVSSALIHGGRRPLGSVALAPAARAEAVVIEAVRKHIRHEALVDNAKLILVHVRKVEVRGEGVAAGGGSVFRRRRPRSRRSYCGVEQESSDTASRGHNS